MSCRNHNLISNHSSRTTNLLGTKVKEKDHVVLDAPLVKQLDYQAPLAPNCQLPCLKGHMVSQIINLQIHVPPRG